MMESTRLTQAKRSTPQLDWYTGTCAQELPLSQVGFLAILLNRATCFVRWLTSEKAKTTSLPVLSNASIHRFSPSTVRATRTNQHGIDIIKHFEGFPADVDPDVRETEQTIRQLVHVPLTSNQFSALVSFTYNVGEATLKQSALLRYLNAGRYRSAAKELDRWVYIGSSRFPKLVARRKAERKLFLLDWPNSKR